MPEPVPQVRGRSRRSIEALAGDVLTRHSPATLLGRSAFDVVGYADGPLEEERAVAFDVVDLGPSIAGRVERGRLIIDCNAYERAIAGVGRDRFTVAHEIGHVLLHLDELVAIEEGANLPALFQRCDLKPYLNPEWQADCFAGALLAPTEGILAILKEEGGVLDSHTLIDLLTHRFKISLQSAGVRTRQLVSDKRIIARRNDFHLA